VLADGAIFAIGWVFGGHYRYWQVCYLEDAQ